MDLDIVRNVVIVANTIGMAVFGVLFWLRKPGEDAGAAVTALRGDILDAHHATDTRLATLEERVKHMPTDTELAELNGNLKQLQSMVQAQGESAIGLRAAVSRIESHLLAQR
jgi:hypothetical protein